MNDGWICWHRTFWDSSFYQEKRKFSRYEAWLDMWMLANFIDKEIIFNNTTLLIKRGEFVTSEKKLADRFGWSRMKLRRFLDELETRQQIRQQKDNHKTVITILEYDTYQSQEIVDNLKRDSERDNKKTTKVPQKDTTNKDNKDKQVKPPLSPLPESLKKIDGFEAAWNKWLEYRKKRKFSCLPMCLEGQFKILMEQPDPIAVIEQSITQGYQGLFPLKGFNNGNNRNGSRQLKARTQYNDGLVFDIDQS